MRTSLCPSTTPATNSAEHQGGKRPGRQMRPPAKRGLEQPARGSGLFHAQSYRQSWDFFFPHFSPMPPVPPAIQPSVVRRLDILITSK